MPVPTRTVSDHLFLDLAREALSGPREKVDRLLRRVLRANAAMNPELRESLASLLAQSPNPAFPLTHQGGQPVPADGDSQFQLFDVELSFGELSDPILSPQIAAELDQVYREQAASETLARNGLTPANTLLFQGPPGVGKTLAARWLAARMRRPLLTLDLAAVMNSYLGKTGANIRAAFEYARGTSCVVFLDEVDALAKRRSDEQEVGELKRLVTVLLQQLDRWPTDSLLIAATNHPDLLDPALWRRFAVHVAFPLPDVIQREALAVRLLTGSCAREAATLVAAAFNGASFHDLERFIDGARRRAVVHGRPLESVLVEQLATHLADLSRLERPGVARSLAILGFTQREICAQTGWSASAVRGYLPAILRNHPGRPRGTESAL